MPAPQLTGHRPMRWGYAQFFGDQVTMPAQDRARRDHATPPAASWAGPRPTRRMPLDPPSPSAVSGWFAQHGDGMPQHQEFDVLGGRRAAEQPQQVQQPQEDDVKQTPRHGQRSCPASRAHRSPTSRRRPTSGVPQGETVAFHGPCSISDCKSFHLTQRTETGFTQ